MWYSSFGILKISNCNYPGLLVLHIIDFTLPSILNVGYDNNDIATDDGNANNNASASGIDNIEDKENYIDNNSLNECIRFHQL